jgi:hypothetical protein
MGERYCAYVGGVGDGVGLATHLRGKRHICVELGMYPVLYRNVDLITYLGETYESRTK